MDPLQLWAGVRFAAQNGNIGGLLTAAAQNGLHLSAITAQPGGFCARCAAWRYPELSRLAAGTGSGSAFRKGTGCFSGCGLCCAAGGSGPAVFVSPSVALAARRGLGHGLHHPDPRPAKPGQKSSCANRLFPPGSSSPRKN